jgi:hypothetical protein
VTRAIAAALVLAVASPASLASQQAISWEGGVITDPGFEDLRTTVQFGVRIASAKTVGMEIALATFPTSLASGRFLLTGDFGMMLTVPMGAREDAWIVPHLGITGLAFSEDAGLAGVYSGLATGFSMGIGYLKATSATRGIRFDLTHRRYDLGADSTDVFVLTVGLAWLW